MRFNSLKHDYNFCCNPIGGNALLTQEEGQKGQGKEKFFTRSKYLSGATKYKYLLIASKVKAKVYLPEFAGSQTNEPSLMTQGLTPINII